VSAEDLEGIWEGGDPLVPPGESGSLEDRTHLPTRTLPPNGFVLKIHVVYDRPFKNRFPNTESQIDQLLVHAQTYFYHSSLSTRFQLSVVRKDASEKYRFLEGSYTSTGSNLESFVKVVQGSSWPDANSYSMLSYENNQGGGIGIAWLKTSCYSDPGYRTNINEFYRNDIKTAQIIVHEIGHNLGMYHDFDGTPSNGRTDSKGNPCTGINGFMDYVSNADKWSGCSVDDLTAYYSTMMGTTGWCMAAITDPTTTTTTKPTTTTTKKTTTTTTKKPTTTTAKTTTTTPGGCTCPPPSTTKKPTTTTKKPTGCVDIKPKSWCDRWNRGGRCQWSSYQILRCPETCGYCKNGKAVCKDFYDDRRPGTCARVAKRNDKYGCAKDYYKLWCAKSCHPDCK